jgi:hypothetical protein
MRDEIQGFVAGFAGALMGAACWYSWSQYRLSSTTDLLPQAARLELKESRTWFWRP